MPLSNYKTTNVYELFSYLEKSNILNVSVTMHIVAATKQDAVAKMKELYPEVDTTAIHVTRVTEAVDAR